MTSVGASMAGPFILKLDHVEVGYDRDGQRVPLVHDVSLTLAPGESLAIVGESGSGKSLTVRAVLGLLAPGLTSHGFFRYGPDELGQLDERGLERVRGREIALILQDPFTMLNPLLSILDHFREMIRMVAPHTRKISDATRERLVEVGIHDPGVLNRFPHELSGGMRQRVALALTLVADPRILIADEVTTGLDTITQANVLRLFRRLSTHRQMSLVMITHDLRLALSHCDRVVVMYAGHIMETCATTELAAPVCHPYTLGLMLSEPPVDRRLPELVSIPGRVPRAADVIEGCAFRSRCDWAAPECATGLVRPVPVIPGSERQSACVRLAQIAPQLKARRRVMVSARDESAGLPAQRPPPLIRVRDIEKTFRARRGDRARVNLAVRGVSLDVGGGECVGLVGSSGSGKTTVARCVVGLESFERGTIEFGDLAVGVGPRSRSERRALCSHAQMVFQDPYSTLNPSLTVGRTLMEVLRCAAERVPDMRAGASTLLERVGLHADYLGRRASSLSGGERQRVAIARALALSPSVLVCDEPVSALDVSIQAQVLGLIRELLVHMNIGCLFITHDLAVVRQVASWIYVMSDGEIVESGPSEHVLEHPTHPYTLELIAAVPQGNTSRQLSPTRSSER